MHLIQLIKRNIPVGLSYIDIMSSVYFMFHKYFVILSHYLERPCWPRVCVWFLSRKGPVWSGALRSLYLRLCWFPPGYPVQTGRDAGEQNESVLEAPAHMSVDTVWGQWTAVLAHRFLVVLFSPHAVILHQTVYALTNWVWNGIFRFWWNSCYMQCLPETGDSSLVTWLESDLSRQIEDLWLAWSTVRKDLTWTCYPWLETWLRLAWNYSTSHCCLG